MFRKICQRCYGTCLVSEKRPEETTFYTLVRCPECDGTGETVNWGWAYYGLPLGLAAWVVAIWVFTS